MCLRSFRGGGEGVTWGAHSSCDCARRDGSCQATGRAACSAQLSPSGLGPDQPAVSSVTPHPAAPAGRAAQAHFCFSCGCGPTLPRPRHAAFSGADSGQRRSVGAWHGVTRPLLHFITFGTCLSSLYARSLVLPAAKLGLFVILSIRSPY